MSLDWADFEGTWYYVYTSYSYNTKTVTGYVH